jgi:phenol hydroxylase P4 protein
MSDVMNLTRDRLENFHGNQLVYLHWQKHLTFCAAMAFPFPPAMPFAAVTGEVMPKFYGMHPDFAKIDWSKVEWTLDGKPFKPAADKSLAENGIGHKSLIQFRTPGLDGFGGAAA